MNIFPAISSLKSLDKKINLIPFYAEIPIDGKNPLQVYRHLRTRNKSFLFESGESLSTHNSYSFIGVNPEIVFESFHSSLFLNGEEIKKFGPKEDILAYMYSEMEKYHSFPSPSLPPFYGGIVGYLSYNSIFSFEPSVGTPKKQEISTPDALFLFFKEITIFDHQRQKIFIVVNLFLEKETNLEESYSQVSERITILAKEIISSPKSKERKIPEKNSSIKYQSNIDKLDYLKAVERAKDYIREGDCFQIVLSQRFETPFSGDIYDFYEILKKTNPSPYMFLFEFGDFSLVGSSPETHISCNGEEIRISPIAGTRKRGLSVAEDLDLEKDLLNDKKECAEHIMLVDLARNDLGRVCSTGSVKVEKMMFIEKYSRVMHMVSNISGKLSDEFTSYDALRATFPAGTVSGSPKIRAMQIINDLEESSRGTYAGVIGYFGWNGNHDSCIMLRTALLKGKKAYVQAGGGIVSDSLPESEYQETIHKASAVLNALEITKL